MQTCQLGSDRLDVCLCTFVCNFYIFYAVLVGHFDEEALKIRLFGKYFCYVERHHAVVVLQSIVAVCVVAKFEIFVAFLLLLRLVDGHKVDCVCDVAGCLDLELDVDVFVA